MSNRPVPTALKIVRGNPGRRPLNPNEPQAPIADTSLPDGFDLSPLAKEQWDNISQHLINSGLLTILDKPALVLYCEACAKWIDANDNVRRYGTVVKAPSGFPVQSPYLAIANKAFDQMKGILVEFGMTPSSRSKVSAANAIAHSENPYDGI